MVDQVIAICAEHPLGTVITCQHCVWYLNYGHCFQMTWPVVDGMLQAELSSTTGPTFEWQPSHCSSKMTPAAPGITLHLLDEIWAVQAAPVQSFFNFCCWLLFACSEGLGVGLGVALEGLFDLQRGELGVGLIEYGKLETHGVSSSSLSSLRSLTVASPESVHSPLMIASEGSWAESATCDAWHTCHSGLPGMQYTMLDGSVADETPVGSPPQEKWVRSMSWVTGDSRVMCSLLAQ